MRVLSALALMLAGLPAAAHAQPGGADPTAQQARQAVQGGIAFLLKDQNSDGSWGSHRGASNTFTGPVWSNPETHRSWTVATTGLCCMALLEAGDSPEADAALDRGIDYLLSNAVLKRPSDWDLDNNWGYLYALQAVAAALHHGRYADTPREARLRAIGQELIERLAVTQTLSGGWGYYSFDLPSRRPAWATSFMTAAVLLALYDAREQGLEVDEGMLERAVRAVKRCRLPNGAYTYSVEAVPDPRHSEWIDQVKGSLGRIQVCNLALYRFQAGPALEQLRVGIDQFFGQHRFLDIARKRPIPHEAYYLNSGYFYLFGHYYAAGVIEQLPPDQRRLCWPKLRRELLKTQEKDGSMVDFFIHSYHRPYGVAFGILALSRSLAERDTQP